MKIEDFYDKPSVHELIEGKDGLLIHARSSVPVAQFEVVGKNLQGQPHLAKFAADKAGFVSMQMLSIREPAYFARLTSGDRVQLTINKRN